MDLKKKKDRLLIFFAKEAGIELKAALYFLCFLFFYFLYRIFQGVWEASIIHMVEMIFSTYAMGYLQVYVFSNFDEGDTFTGKTFFYSAFCSGLYTVVAYLGKWFDESMGTLGLFYIYVLLAYICAYWMYKIKRLGDTKALNEDLKAFQERSREHGECD
ncbi:MAG: DUF3021 domain-containing protein [Lachnospiraceae bacterium]|nr:DUF3021 domain-containing protein [Lachnospiraceae bacterium]